MMNDNITSKSVHSNAQVARVIPIINQMEVLADKVPLTTPYGVAFSIGNVCDFKCIYCTLAALDKVPENIAAKPAMMSFDSFKRIASQLKEFDEPIKQVSFVSRGETILNKDLPKMISYIKENHLANSVKVLSNANKLTNDLSIKLIDAGLDVLKISLQGVTSEMYMKTCKTKVDFDQFVEQIRFFYEHSRGKCTLQVKVIDIALINEYEEELFYKIFSNISDYMFIEQCADDLSNNSMEHPNKFRIDLTRMQICPMPFYTMTIEHTGNVNPCCNVTEISIGEKAVIQNAFQKSLKQMWDEDFKALQLSLLKQEIPKGSICHGCKLFLFDEKTEDLLDHKKDEILMRFTGETKK